MLQHGKFVAVYNVIPSYKKPIKLLVKKLFNYCESNTQPMSSFKIGVYIINTSEMSKMFSIRLENIKFNCFFSVLSNDSAFVPSLCHELD